MSETPFVVFLGGNGISNKAWVEELRDAFQKFYPKNYIQYYEHWKDKSNSEINFEIESKKLYEELKDKKDFVIIAKSAGIFVSLITIYNFKINPRYCLFFGFPTSWLDERGINYTSYLTSHQIPTTIFQNDHDPFCSYNELKNLLNSIGDKKISLVSETGNTHDYKNYEKYIGTLRNGIDKSQKVTLSWIKTKNLEKYKPHYQVYAVCFNENGEVLVRHDGEKYSLPGGTPEKGETVMDTLKRELIEELDVTVKKAIPLGVQKVEEKNGRFFYQYRFICLIDKLLPQTPDPDTGRIYERLLVPQEVVTKLIKWGEVGNEMFKDAFLEFPNLLQNSL